jgi:murein L,D-transpeptidase YcbB/YkuD
MLAMRRFTLSLLILTFIALPACGTSATDPVATALASILGGQPPIPVGDKTWTAVRDFYALRSGAPAWVADEVTPKAKDAIRVLQLAHEHGLDLDHYHAADLEARRQTLKDVKKDAANRAEVFADFDTRLTTALMMMGHDVAIGRSTPHKSAWKARREMPDLAGTLNTAVSGDMTAWLAAIQPTHPEYEALRQALIDLEGLREQGGLPTPSTPEAIRVFQEHHAIPATGKLDAATKAAMAVPLDDRIYQVKLNMERWRWMPDDLGTRHFLVNIPFFHLQARENGKVVKDIRVVVGKPGNETPIFSDEMETVVFSPYWNIPDSIVEGETAPAMARDPRYLARNNIEILRVGDSGASAIDPASVNWDNPDELKQLAFRQRPGASNALGHVKFLFPNEHNVYLHDTPADQLFARPGRAFSHGCVRVEEPEVLAQYVLRHDPSWDLARIREAMHAGVEKHVKLAEKVPVHIVYFTAWVDDAKGLHFQPDVYGYDKKR